MKKPQMEAEPQFHSSTMMLGFLISIVGVEGEKKEDQELSHVFGMAMSWHTEQA